MTKKVSFLLLIAACITCFCTSCSNYANLLKSTDYTYKYEAAKQYYDEGKYSRAAYVLQDIVTALKGTDLADESLFLLGMSAYRSGDYGTASTYLSKYYESYPHGTYAEEAHYYRGRGLYLVTPDVRLDQTETYEAITELQNFLDLYPTTRFKDEAQRLIFSLQDKIIDKEYLSAKLYYDLGSYFGNATSNGSSSNYEACIITAQNALKDYPYTTRREDFSLLVLRSKFELADQSIETKKAERYRNAVDEYYGFKNEFPESKHLAEMTNWFTKASKYIQKTQSSNGLQEN